jgi:hypothetical protein
MYEDQFAALLVVLKLVVPPVEFVTQDITKDCEVEEYETPAVRPNEAVVTVVNCEEFAPKSTRLNIVTPFE